MFVKCAEKIVHGACWQRRAHYSGKHIAHEVLPPAAIIVV